MATNQNQNKAADKRQGKAASGATLRHSWRHPLRSWANSHRDSARLALHRVTDSPSAP